MSNSIGNIFRLTSFGESHGKAIGGVIDGCPAGIEIDETYIQLELNRRKPGQSKLTTPRDEADKVEFLSGIFEGKTTGTPIGFLVWNTNQESKDYLHLKDVFRPSHADFTYQTKYGTRDYRGGGRSSARETIARVVAGAIAKLALQQLNIVITAYTSQVGPIAVSKPYTALDLTKTEDNDVRCPEAATAKKMQDYILQLKKDGDSTGGIITCVAQHVPVGWGEPVFTKLQAKLADAMLSINACKGLDYGSGFEYVDKKGSEINDEFFNDHGKINTKTNYSGGVQGGISNGQDIYFRVVFKPTATILREQNTVDSEGNDTTLKAHGRHDPCVLPRAVPIVEAMTAITLFDLYLLSKSTQPF